MTRILITNDDGIDSPVLLPLARALADHAEVSVVVPDCQQSGVGHGFTFHSSLTYSPINYQDVDFYTVHGTPADCVKFAVCKLFQDQKFDLVISGVNDQLNAGVAIYYSGTVAGAREAALLGIPGLAISAENLSSRNLDYGVAWLVEFVRGRLHDDIPQGKYWNVNLPNCSAANFQGIQGVKFTEMGRVMYEDGYYFLRDGRRLDDMDDAPTPDRDYQLIGKKPEAKMRPGDDDFERLNGFVTITPLTLDMGDSLELSRLTRKMKDINQHFQSLSL